LKAAGTTTYASDANTGQRCEDTPQGGASRHYTWAGDETLASVEESGSGLTAYAYDHNGDRFLSASKAQGTTHATVFLDELLEYDTATGETSEFFKLPGVTCKLPGKQRGYCAFMDAMNAAAAFDDSGAPLNLATYSPFGKMIPLTGGPPLPFGFNGKRVEGHGELVYFGARYHDTSSAQFLSVDPLRWQGEQDFFESANLLQPFAFAAQNPTTRQEYRGLQPSDPESLPERSVLELKNPNAGLDPRFRWVFPPEIVRHSAPEGYQVDVVHVLPNYADITEAFGHTAMVMTNLATGKRTGLSWHGDYENGDLIEQYSSHGRDVLVYSYNFSSNEGKAIVERAAQLKAKDEGWCMTAVHKALLAAASYREAIPVYSTFFWPNRTPGSFDVLLLTMHGSGALRFSQAYQVPGARK
jgi:RHS repeat-associated protein